MYAAGIPVGLFVDSKGPRPGVMMGAFLLGIGYYVMHKGWRDPLDGRIFHLTPKSIQRWTRLDCFTMVVLLPVPDWDWRCSRVFRINQDM